MLLQYSFPNFLASQDVTKITRDLNCKYMEAPRMVTPPPPSSRLTSAKNPPRGKMAVEKDVEGPFSSPPTPPISFMLSRQGIGDVKRAFDDTCASLLAPSSPILAQFENGPSEGKWILARDRNRIKRNPADRNDFALRPNRGPAGNLRCSVSCPSPAPTPVVLDDLHRASVFGQYNG